MRIRYLGTGPGQAARIRIVGVTFVRGETVEVPDALGLALLKRAGFEPELGEVLPPTEDPPQSKRRRG